MKTKNQIDRETLIKHLEELGPVTFRPGFVTGTVTVLVDDCPVRTGTLSELVSEVEGGGLLDR